MFARNLMIWLHERLAQRGMFEQTEKRFESLRGGGLLPRGRKNASARLSNEQIANAVLGFGHSSPGFACHASLALGDLRPVGGTQASFRNARSLQELVAALIGAGGANSNILRLTLSVGQDFSREEYTAAIYSRESGQPRITSFVSKNAYSLFEVGAEEGYDHDRLSSPTSVQRSFGSTFFQDLSRTVALSRHLNQPFETDWREYETEEEEAEFYGRLGVRAGSQFLNMYVDAQVAWPKEPTKIEFGGHHLLLFPKTKESSHSISIDLTQERISSNEARSLMSRLLSMMSWCDDQPASLHDGFSGSPVPMPVPRHNPPITTMHEWHFYRTLPRDENLLRSLTFYRDGLNALSVSLASHSVLSFYRIFEVKFGNKTNKIVGWLDNFYDENMESVPRHILENIEKEKLSRNLSFGDYIRKCRVATAHAAVVEKSDTDIITEFYRLIDAAEVMKLFSRNFIIEEYRISDSYLSD